MPGTTKERLTEAAGRRFYRDGFRNVGLDQVLDDVGISKTAFYKHFACKEDLMLAVLDMRNEWLRETFRSMVMERATHPADQLRAIFDVVEMVIRDPEFQGCIFVNVAMEFPLPHEPIHVAAARHKQEIEQLVHDLAARAGAADPAGLARELCLIIEGAYVTRMVTGEPASIDVARRLADLVLQMRLPPTAGPVN